MSNSLTQRAFYPVNLANLAVKFWDFCLFHITFKFVLTPLSTTHSPSPPPLPKLLQSHLLHSRVKEVKFSLKSLAQRMCYFDILSNRKLCSLQISHNILILLANTALSENMLVTLLNNCLIFPTHCLIYALLFISLFFIALFLTSQTYVVTLSEGKVGTILLLW